MVSTRRAALLLFGFVAGCTGKSADTPKPASTAVAAAGAPDSLPATPLGAAARRGLAILTATRDSLPEFVGNALRCTSCHLDEGRRPYAMPWTGVHARYPQYRSRSATVQSLEDRINDCLQRSLAGKPLPPGDSRMRAMEAYMAFLSAGTPVGGRTTGQGIDSVHATTPDTAKGAGIFAATCARCHGDGGDGTMMAPPVWGNRSYTIGAGMARTFTAAAFIRRNMPFDQPGSLSEQDALNVAAYLDTRARADFAGKEHDWPNGNAPPDVPYKTLGKPTQR